MIITLEVNGRKRTFIEFVSSDIRDNCNISLLLLFIIIAIALLNNLFRFVVALIQIA